MGRSLSFPTIRMTMMSSRICEGCRLGLPSGPLSNLFDLLPKATPGMLSSGLSPLSMLLMKILGGYDLTIPGFHSQAVLLQQSD